MKIPHFLACLWALVIQTYCDSRYYHCCVGAFAPVTVPYTRGIALGAEVKPSHHRFFRRNSRKMLYVSKQQEQEHEVSDKEKKEAEAVAKREDSAEIERRQEALEKTEQKEAQEVENFIELVNGNDSDNDEEKEKFDQQFMDMAIQMAQSA